VRTIELLIEHKGINALNQKGFLKRIGLSDDKLKIPAGEQKFFSPGPA
jgi:hypothetical protein